MSTMKKLRRPSEDATQEERRAYFRDLREALDEAGIGHGQEFFIVPEYVSPEQAQAVMAAHGPAAEAPDDDGLGGFARESKTSRRAALDNYPRSGTQRARVLEHMMASEEATHRGFTRDELAVALDMPPNVLTPRVKELIDGGWVQESEETRKTRARSDATVLFVTEKSLTWNA